MSTFPWSIFFILAAAGLFGAIVILPYALTLNPKVMEQLKAARSKQPVEVKPGEKPKKLPPMPVLILASVMQSLLLVGIATFVGLLAAQQVGLGLPVLQAVLNGQPVGGLIAELLPATLALSVLTGVIIITLEYAYFLPRIARAVGAVDGKAAFWKRVLACFYGGIDEEIFMRLFLMSGLAWLVGLIWQDTASGLPAAGALWVANILAAVLFGLGHLPATAMQAKLTPTVVARAVLLNGIPGVAFGYLYMRYGLEAAILAHFSLDIAVHLLAVGWLEKRRVEVFDNAAVGV